MATPKSIDEYIGRFPVEVQHLLQQIRETIAEMVPEAEEAISYGIPAFYLNRRYLIYFAGYKNHISIYPAPVGNAEFEEDFAPYNTSKGTVQFPLSESIPLDLVKKIVRFREAENAKGK